MRGLWREARRNAASPGGDELRARDDTLPGMATDRSRPRVGGVRTHLLGLGALVALTVCAAAAPARGAASLLFDVTFSASGAITVTLPDGTPVGTTSGAPTVIPAGYYTISLSGPMGLPAGLPYFHLSGPGVNLLSNLNEGGLASDNESATFLPSSSYTWTDDSLPGVVWTFTTSSQSVGAPPAPPVSPESGPPAEGTDVVGSAIIPVRGTISAALTAGGTLTVRIAGKRAASLAVGRYRIAVTDTSERSGLTLAKEGHPAESLSGAAFRGERSLSVDLTAGRWTFARNPGGRAAVSLLVS